MALEIHQSPECVIFNKAPVAFRCTLMSFDLANFVSGVSAPDLAILALFSSWVAKLVMHPTALHCTSTFCEFICLINGANPPSLTIATLFSADESISSEHEFHIFLDRTVDRKISQSCTCSSLDFNICAL